MLDIELLYDLTIPLSMPQRIENGNSNGYLCVNIHSSIIHYSQKVETTHMFINK